MKIELRDYQKEGIQKVSDFFMDGGLHAIVIAPTGAGKTYMFSFLTSKAQDKGNKTLIMTDRGELLIQTGGSLRNMGVNPFFIQAGSKYINYNASSYVAMTQTLRRRIDLYMWRNWIKNSIDFVIIDECHLQSFNYMFESGLLDNKPVLGFTATPRRSGKMRQLALDYEKIIKTVTVSELIEKGQLVRDDYFGVAGVNLENIEYDKKKGDYSEKDMFSRFNSTKLYAGVVKNWIDEVPNSHTLVFCVNIEHVIHTCEEFQKNGIDARFLVSEMSKPKEPNDSENKGAWARYEERMRLYSLYKDSYGRWSGTRSYIVSKFKRKEFPVLINAGILTTGFDAPCIETIVVNRATLSATLWLQMIGRGSRPSPGKTSFTILDFGDNASRLGHYTAPQHYRLWHEESKGGGIPPMKDCAGCQRLIMASYNICPFCGYKYPKKKAKEVDLSLIVFDERTHTVKSSKKISDMNDQELVEYAKGKGHQQAWLWRQLYFRGGIEKIEAFGREKKWKQLTIERAVEYCKGL